MLSLIKGRLTKLSMFILMLLTLTGCFEEFDPKLDQQPVLCMNADLCVGTPVKVELSHTVSGAEYKEQYVQVYENDIFFYRRDQWVEDARMTLYVNGESKGEMRRATWFDVKKSASPYDMLLEKKGFESDYIPQAGDEIRIEAVSAGYGAAEASIVMPYPIEARGDVKIGKVEVLGVEYDSAGELVQYSVRFNDLRSVAEIKDNPEVYNYFDVSARMVMPQAPEGIYLRGMTWHIDTESDPIFSEHISAMETVLESNHYDFSVFSDYQFAGGTYPLKLYDEWAYIAYQNPEKTPTDFDPTRCKFEFCISNISKPYYDWLLYTWQYNEGMIGQLGTLGLAEMPASVSNVSSGAGVVGARAVTYITLDLSPVIREGIEKFANDE